MAIQVTNEIKQLKKVLLHRPYKELENIVPDSLESLLFDDIPYLKNAQYEHDAFASALRESGAEVLYLEDLVAEVLSKSSDVKEKFIKKFIYEASIKSEKYKDAVYSYLNSFKDSKELVLKTMAGIRFNEIDCASEGKLASLMDRGMVLVTDPMPNLYFTRDPFASIGNGVSLNTMYSITRNRETIYGEFIFDYHQDFAGKVKKYFDRYDSYHIEGGDILNLNEKTLCIGISQRTMPEAIEKLASNLFSSECCKVDTVLAFDIPNSRAFMHLDTVFTQIDYDKFTIHPAILGPLRVFELKKVDGSGAIKINQIDSSLEKVLARYLDISSVELIKCGNGDFISSAREQWNDGSNTLCVSPGKIIVYDRNNITNKVLVEKGLDVIQIPSGELSRGRGGPRCMSMPIVREV